MGGCLRHKTSRGARLYKTGDLARYLPDGNLENLDRLDHQVKSHGFRIELGKVEAGLEQHAAIRQTVVLAREYAPGNTRLVAYIVTHQELAPTSSELHSFLKPNHCTPGIQPSPRRSSSARVAFGYNEHAIPLARKLARELSMTFSEGSTTFLGYSVCNKSGNSLIALI